MVSGKNWTAAARAPGKLLLKLIFPGCAHCHAAPMVEFLSKPPTFGGQMAVHPRGGSRIFVRGGTRRWSMQGAMCAQPAVTRGSGGMPPRNIVSFRLSEIDSGAFWVSA